MRHYKKIITLLILVISSVYTLVGQINDYRYQRKLNGIKDDWHILNIDDEILTQAQPNFQDIRIYGISSGNDTVPIPYIINHNTSYRSVKDMSLEN